MLNKHFQSKYEAYQQNKNSTRISNLEERVDTLEIHTGLKQGPQREQALGGRRK